MADPRMPGTRKESLSAVFATFRDCIIGPDMRTNERDMTYDENGRSVGLPRGVGGIPLDEFGGNRIRHCHGTKVSAGLLRL
jgi:glutamate dehydrogenase (NAD(P)+)